MKEQILEICNRLNRMQITVSEANQQLLDLFDVSKRHLIQSILEDMDSKHSEYHREVVENYLDDGC